MGDLTLFADHGRIGFVRLKDPKDFDISLVTAYLYPSLMDFSVADVAGERSPLAGEYTISFGIERAARHGMGYAEAKLSAVDEPVVESAVV